MVEKIPDGVIKRMRNLNRYQGKSDEEIRAEVMAKRERDALIPKGTNDTSYEVKFKEKLLQLQDEFGVDMNDANDREMLSSLVRHMIQSEVADGAIRAIYDHIPLNRMDFLNLKNLGEYQGTVDRTVSELQDKLGISRKLRKERQSDDIPQWVDSVREKAKTFFDRQTVKVECPTCRIELYRYWINFPKVEIKKEGKMEVLPHTISVNLPCWNCHQYTLYNA